MKKLVSILLVIALLGCVSAFASGEGGGSGLKHLRTEEVPDPDAPQIVRHPQPVNYVLAGTDYEAPVYAVAVTVPETTLTATDTHRPRLFGRGRAGGALLLRRTQLRGDTNV